MSMKKIGLSLLLVLTFIFKHGPWIFKTIVTFLAGEAISTVVVDPLVTKYINSGDKEKIDCDDECIDKRLQSEAIHAFRSLEKQDVTLDQHDQALKQLRSLSQKHGGLLWLTAQNYFTSDQEAQTFFEKWKLVIVR